MTGTSEAGAFDVLVVGAGHAGANVAMELAARGYAGSVALLDADTELPYQRPPLTKAYLAGELQRESLAIGRHGFWSDDAVTLRSDCKVTEIDPDAHTVTTSGGAQFRYGALVWAAGGRSRPLGLEGEHLPGVHRIRTIADADGMRDALRPGRRLVVIGGGFVGLETAAAGAKVGAEVTVVEAENRLLARVTSPSVSTYFEARHRAAGVQVLLGQQVRGLRQHGAGIRVDLGPGNSLEAEAVLVAIGIMPEIEALARAGARCGDGVEVDEYGRTSLPDVYAVGDCASFPYVLHTSRRARVECIQNAVDAAKNVAAALAGEPMQYLPQPWFWSNQYDVKFKSVGLVAGHDQSLMRGDPATGRFSVVYLKHDTVLAVDAVNATKDYVDARGMLGRRVDAAKVTDLSIRLAAALCSQVE